MNFKTVRGTVLKEGKPCDRGLPLISTNLNLSTKQETAVFFGLLFLNFMQIKRNFASAEATKGLCPFDPRKRSGAALDPAL